MNPVRKLIRLIVPPHRPVLKIGDPADRLGVLTLIVCSVLPTFLVTVSRRYWEPLSGIRIPKLNLNWCENWNFRGHGHFLC